MYWPYTGIKNIFNFYELHFIVCEANDKLNEMESTFISKIVQAIIGIIY